METITFEDLGLDGMSLEAVEAKGFTTPTPIQILAIPRLLNGEANVIAKARTGTGKTAAFGLPIIQNLRHEARTPKALILVPTRELALQVEKELFSLINTKNPRITSLYGGQSMMGQIKALKHGVEIVVGTPGRVQDHINRKTLDISQIDYFILDDGERMSCSKGYRIGRTGQIQLISLTVIGFCRIFQCRDLFLSLVLQIVQFHTHFLLHLGRYVPEIGHKSIDNSFLTQVFDAQGFHFFRAGST